MAARIAKLTLRGYKTYADVTRFPLGQLNVLIGGNGSGKSNLLSFFSFLSKAMAPPGGMQLAVGKAGGASKLLTYGVTRAVDSISVVLELEFGQDSTQYKVRLERGADDRLVVAQEFLYDVYGSMEEEAFLEGGGRALWSTDKLGAPELSIQNVSDGACAPGAEAVIGLFKRLRIYSFMNTSEYSPIRSSSAVHDCHELMPDASNLAAFLMRLDGGNAAERASYRRIVNAVRVVLPFFSEFVFQPTGDFVLLHWRELGCDHVFSASQAADGMLRYIALVSLLSLPEHLMPPIIMIDEPELGLHPEALSMIGELLKGASEQTQVIVATQSVELVDQFSIEDLVVVSRSDRYSKLLRLKEEDFASWRENYSVGTLWRKNVIAAGPGE